MKKLIILFFMSISLSACSFFRPHKMDIEQGNIIQQQDVAKLHTGMRESEVRAVMGNPLLVTLFTNNRLNYVYTMRRGYEQMQLKKVIVVFQNGSVIRVIS